LTTLFAVPAATASPGLGSTWSASGLDAASAVFRSHPPKQRPRQKPKPQPRPHRRPSARRPRATPSFYVHSTAPSVLWKRGCRAGRYRAFGIVILAFGKPYHDGHSYGTLTFSHRFASNRQISLSMAAFARGYVACLPRPSRAHIVLARGTSNYFTWVPSQFQAGRRWARETVAFARFLRRSGLARRVSSAAAIDAEPAWNRSFIRTRDFFSGYRAYGPGHALYNYGSLDGGVGKIWDARQIWFVTGGMKYARPLPEIYYPFMAAQWARMSRIAVRRYGRPLRFAGLMTQHTARCSCGYRPKDAHRALVLALRADKKTWVRRLPAITNIRWN
jgi:hypothetical protein